MLRHFVAATPFPLVFLRSKKGDKTDLFKFYQGISSVLPAPSLLGTAAGLAIKLQAIISCASHPIQTVARIIGVQRQSPRGWILDFRKVGVSGLVNKPKGHRKSSSTRNDGPRWQAGYKEDKPQMERLFIGPWRD
jgi:hypothetical protein